MDTLFFIASKLIGALLRPDTWIVIALGLIVLALLTQRRRLALWASSVTLAALFSLAILPLGDLLLQPIERTYPAQLPLERVDGIIVLGGGEDAPAAADEADKDAGDGVRVLPNVAKIPFEAPKIPPPPGTAAGGMTDSSVAGWT